MTSLRERAEAWFAGSDTGISSRAIWCWMMGHTTFWPLGGWSPDPPFDDGDFGRCHRLLQQFPEWRPRLCEMSHLPGWDRLIPYWDELEHMYEAAGPIGRKQLYRRMQELLG